MAFATTNTYTYNLFLHDADLSNWCLANPGLMEPALKIGRRILTENLNNLENLSTVQVPADIDSSLATAAEKVLESQTVALLTKQIEALTEQNKNLFQELHSRSDDSTLVNKLEVLSDQNKSLLFELKMAVIEKSKTVTTIGRGQEGENIILELAKQQWPAAEIHDMTGVSEASDLHIVHENQRLVIECKNKAIITVDDIRKSNRDIQSLADAHPDFTVYAFISLRSSNLPGKGSLAIEQRSVRTADGQRAIWVLWGGADSLDDSVTPRALLRFCHVLMQQVSVATTDSSASDLEWAEHLVRQLRPHLDRLLSIRRTALTFKEKISSLGSTYMDLERLVQDSYTAFEAQMLPIINEVEAKREAAKLTCPKCKKAYVIKSAFDRHVEKCK